MLARTTGSIAALAVAASLGAPATAQITTRVSVDGNGIQGNYGTYEATTSANGRIIAFHSAATNLVPGDTNNNWDVFAYDRVHGEISRVHLALTVVDRATA